MDVKHGWVEKFHGDELIVPIPQLGAVRAALTESGVGLADVEENRTLGLARLSGLTGIEAAASRLLEDPAIRHELTAYRDERNAAHPRAPEVSDLAVLIEGVRLLLDRRYPGWQITIGKNYRPSLIRGYPHTEPWGDGEPTPTSENFTKPIEPAPGPGAGRGVKVGVLDTRLFPHPTLVGHLDPRADLLRAYKGQLTEFDGHCTFVASCILQQAPAAKLYPRRVLDRNGDGSAWEAAVAIANLVPLGLDVVNLSFGEYMTDDDSAPMVLAAAIGRLSRDTVVVAAAGNNGDVDRARARVKGPDANTANAANDVPPGITPHTTSYPAALPDVVGVGAVDAKDDRAPFTPKDAPWITLLARGVNLNAAYLDGKVQVPSQAALVPFTGTANWAGCSFAAGAVSGVIAARTAPGQRTARQALDELVASLQQQARPGLLIN